MNPRSRQTTSSDAPASAVEYGYPMAEKLAVAESPEQSVAIDILFHSLEALARERGWSETQVGSHRFFAWKQDEPLTRLAPDVFLLPEPPSISPASWQTWLPGHAPPRWAAEIVSSDWAKDYRVAPDRYEELGCTELVLFDPAAASGQAYNKARVPITIHHRAADGAFQRTYAGPGPAFSDELGCWLLPRYAGYWMVLRLSGDRDGQQIVLTDAERAKAQLQQLEAQREQVEAEKRRARAEKRRASAEKQRADAEAKARAAAEARVKELEAALKRLKGERDD